MTSDPVGFEQPMRFGEDFELEMRQRRLRRGRHVLKLERIPLEILVLLIERPGEIVSRDEIVARVWGNNVFLDTGNSIRGAIRKVRQALKDDPETPRFIQTVTGRGYRFIAPVRLGKEEHLAELSKAEALTVPTGEQNQFAEVDPSVKNRVAEAEERTASGGEAVHGKQHGRRGYGWLLARVAALAVVGVLSVLAFWQWQRASSLRTASQKKVVLAVLPFDNLSRYPDQEYFSEGLTDEMIAQIGKLNRDRLTVIARGSVAKYKGSKLTAKEIGSELNADYLVEGSVRGSSERARITVQLIQAKDQTDVWTESYDRELKDVLAVQDSVVQSIATQIHVALTDEQKTHLTNPRRAQSDAYVAYLKGRYYWNKRTAENIEKAEAYFQQAIDTDPSYAEAYSGLADCNSGLAWHGFKAPADALPKAQAAARKAIEIDPQSAEAHASLGLALSHSWDWQGAEAEFRRALQLDPQYANAHHWYADYLSIRRRHDEALSQARRALELDPLNLMISTLLGLRYYLAHNYSAAIEQNRESVELDPNFAAAHLLLGDDYVQQGEYKQAVQELKKAAALSGGSPLYIAQLGVAMAAAGRRQEAVQIANQLQSTSHTRYVSVYGLAQIYAALNDKQNTFRWLQAAYDDRAVWMGYLAVDPAFEHHRSDPRFQDLVRRIGLL